jgi:hypothetical protein
VPRGFGSTGPFTRAPSHNLQGRCPGPHPNHTHRLHRQRHRHLQLKSKTLRMSVPARHLKTYWCPGLACQQELLPPRAGVKNEQSPSDQAAAAAIDDTQPHTTLWIAAIV